MVCGQCSPYTFEIFSKMENCDRLIQFIDRNTDRGTEEIPEIFGEKVRVEDSGVEYLNQFIDRDLTSSSNLPFE